MTKILFPIIFLTCLAAYSSSLSGEFVWDDVPQIVENPYIKDLSYTSLYFKKGIWSLTRMQATTPYYRPFFLLSIALNYKAWGLNPLGYKITNLILHFIVIFFVYLIADMILNDKVASLIASAVFALHPANTEVVAWISGRTDMIAGIFLLPAFLLHFKGRYYFSVPLFIFALLSKETSIVFPVIAASYGIVSGRKPLAILKEITPYLIPIGIYLVIRGAIFGGNAAGLVFTHAKFVLLTEVILHYIRFLIFPYPVTFLPNAIPKMLPFDIIGTMIFAGIITFLFKKNKKAVIFLFIWIVLTFLPALTVVFNPIQINLGYRFVYLPSIGYAIMVGVLVSGIIKNAGKKVRYAISLILIIILLMYSSLIYVRGFEWRSTMALWEDSVKHFPDSSFAHNSMASSIEGDNIEKQIYHYKMAVTLDAKSGNSYIGLGTAYAKLGNYTIAKEHIEKGIKHASTYTSMSAGYNSLGNINYLEGDNYAAIKMYRKAIEIDDFNAEAYYNLAMALKSAGRDEEAAVYRKRYESLMSGSTPQ